MGWIKNMVMRLFKIIPATDREITIKEPLTFQENVLKNKIWYRGDPAELEQFFKQVARYPSYESRFWAVTPFRKVRKIHSGIVQITVDRFKDIITADLNGISFGEEGQVKPLEERWNEIALDNKFSDLLGSAVAGALSSGDGAFKISVDEENKYPIIEFYEADNVAFTKRRGRLTEIKFYTKYSDQTNERKEYRLEETYGRGYVTYKLYNENGKEVPMDTLEDTAVFQDVSFDGDFIMGEPLIFFPSSKWEGRGKALFDAKTDDLDALDEVISQWLDAVRKGRINRYIPEDLVPRTTDGQMIEPNDFDNDYIAIGSAGKEGFSDKIEIVQPDISYEAYVNSYSSFLDLALQGIVSPATLGIDLKKNDSSESQREKEKITIYTRGKLVEVLGNVLPELANKCLKVQDLMENKRAGEYKASAKFGEYAAPGFDNVVETVGKAKTYGVMSIDKAVEEMYGDTLTQEEKETEISRIKQEQGIMDMEEPGVNLDADGFRIGGTNDDRDDRKENIPNE
jgi:hypothetical protein